MTRTPLTTFSCFHINWVEFFLLFLSATGRKLFWPLIQVRHGQLYGSSRSSPDFFYIKKAQSVYSDWAFFCLNNYNKHPPHPRPYTFLYLALTHPTPQTLYLLLPCPYRPTAPQHRWYCMDNSTRVVISLILLINGFDEFSIDFQFFNVRCKTAWHADYTACKKSPLDTGAAVLFWPPYQFFLWYISY